MRVAALEDIGRLTEGIELDLRAGRLEAASAKLAELRALTALLAPRPRQEPLSDDDIALMRLVAPFICDAATAAALDRILARLEPNAAADAADGSLTVEDRVRSRHQPGDFVALLGLINASTAMPPAPSAGEVH